MSDAPQYRDTSSLEQSAETLEFGALEPLPKPAPSTMTTVDFLKQPRVLATVIGLVVILVTITVLSLISGHNKPVQKVASTAITINTQSLSNGTLTKLTTTAGAANQTSEQLTISPSVLFKSTVEVQGNAKADQNVDIGGNLNVAGKTVLQGATGVNGDLAVRGALSVGGTLSAANLNVGALAVTNVTASGDVNFGGHLVPSGTTPTAKVSVAAAGGTVAISGNDTAGTVTITTGSGGQIAGELAIITFRTAFSSTPKVQLTPITAASASLQYYATRGVSMFSANTGTPPTANTTYVFDYLVTE